MRATEFITLPLPEKEGLNEMIQIPMGRKGRAIVYAPAMLYHNLRGRDLGRDGSIQGYPISAREKELEELFPTPSPDGYVWLSLQPGYGGNDYITIDATKLDPANLRYTGQSEGFIIHKGSIPANAITLRRSNKWEGLLMKSTEFLTESDKEHRAALNQTGFWGKQGAGCLFLAKDTGRICIAHRSQAVEQPGTWGTWGGAIDSGEDPAAAARREVIEEAGYTGKLNLIPLFIFSHPSGFKYYNFLALVDKEFTPITNWETQNSAWFDYGNWPKPLHPGLVTLLSDSASTAIIQKYARAKTKKVQTKKVKPQFEARPDKAAMKSIERHYSKYKYKDHEAISDYTSGEGSFNSNSRYLNKPLYKAKGAVPKEIQSWTNNTDALVARHKTPNDMTAYYGISRNPKLFSYGSNLIKNNKKTITAPFVFVNYGYTSTSLDPDIAWTFARNQLIDSSNKSVIQSHMLIIKIPKGFFGAYVGHLSAQKDRYGGKWDEMELILPRGTSFTISPNPSVIKKTERGTTLYVFKWKAVAISPVTKK